MYSKLRASAALVVFLLLAPSAWLAAQDTRTVNEPAFPAACATLQAQLTIAAGEPSSETAFDTTRIQSALNSCASGSAVELTTNGASNAFLIQPLTIPNGVTLLVDAGATVFASRNPADYQIAGNETCGTVGTLGNGCNPLFNINQNAASSGSGLMGFGIINGRGGDKLVVNGVTGGSSWWDLANQANTSKGAQNNPVLLAANNASNFTVYKITLQNSPMFHITWKNASGLTIWGVKIITPYSARNTNGINSSDSVNNITISNSYISDGDDNVAINAANGPASNISILNSNTYSGHGVAIGSYTTAGVSNVLVMNHNAAGNLSDVNSGALRIKSASDRGGLVNNVTYQNVCIQNEHYNITFDPNFGGGTGTNIPTYSNIGLHFVTVLSEGIFQIQGEDANHLLGLTMDNLNFLAFAGRDLTPAPQYATLNLGPGPVNPTVLQQLTGPGISYTGNITKPTEFRYNCNTANFPFLAGELFLSTPTATNASTLSLPNPATFTLNAVVEPVESSSATPTSAIQFFEGKNKVGTGTLGGNGTVAQLTLTGIPSGTHTYTAVYPTDIDYNQLNFGSVTVIVNANPTTTTMTATPSSAPYGSSIALTATVASTAGTPSGNVIFRNGSTVLGTVALNASGTATLNTTTLKTGSNVLTAYFTGSTNFAISNSSQTPVTVTISQAGSTTTVSASPANAIYGTAVVLTATLASNTTGTPTGSVTFMDGTTTLGSAILSGATAKFTTRTLNTGAHNITAIYGGDANFTGSTSATPFTVTIFTAPSSTTVGFTSSTVSYGTSVTMLAAINGGNATTATGTVTFKDGTTTLNVATVSSGVASYSTSALTVGQHNITATYSGDSNYTGSTSSSVPLTVTQAASTTAVRAASLTPVYGSSDSFTATVSSSGTGTPTGTVTFMDGASTLAANVALTAGTATFSTSALTGGSHSITAVYSGDANYLASTSPAVGVTVSTAATTTALTAPASITYGGSASLSATITSSAAGTPTGTVTFLDSGTAIGTATVVGGTATFSAPGLTGGNHTLTAMYSGDTNYTASTSAPSTLTVNKAATTTGVAASPSTTTYGSSTTFTATLAPTGATGTVTFKDGSATLGTGTISGGAATYSTSALTAGAHSITAVYSGDNNYLTSTSASAAVTVNQATPTTTVTATPSTITYGSSTTLTATLSSTAATGTVIFKDGAATLGTVPVAGGAASFNAASLAGGSHSITAIYSGDTNFTTSTSAPTTVQVNAASTTTTVAANPATIPYGSATTLTATVSNAQATGTITFKDGAATLGAGTISNGSATFNAASLSGGQHAITAVYSGDTNFATSTSAVFTVTVSLAATTTTASANPSTINYGSATTLSATVSPASATGTVTFRDGAAILGTAPLSGGNASFNAASLGGGQHAITAAYSGDTNFASSTSSAVAVTVNPAASTTSVSANPTTASYGSSIGLTATVAPAGATGTVVFKDGGATIGTSAVSGGVASISTATLGVGTHSITASYSGDANFTGSNSSAAATVTISAASTTTSLSATPNPINYGGATTLTATLNSASATGSITFRDGAATLGTVAVSNGAASFNAAGFGGGQHSITAVYSGDTNFGGSTSSAVIVTVNLAATAAGISASPTTIAYGASTTLSATVSPAAATGSITFRDGGATLATVPVTGGTAAFTVAGLTGGQHSITAVYSGDSNYAASSSAAAVVTVTLASTSTTVAASPTSIAFGSPATLSATVAPSTATGLVTFRDGSAVLGTAPLSGGVATFTASSLSGGSHTISASYAGDANYSGSASTNTVQVVVSVSASSVVAAANPSTIAFGSATSLSATVTPNGGTGTVTFRDSGIALGTATLSNGSAALTVSGLLGGTHSITATYSGDVNVGGSTSAAIAVNVTPGPVGNTLAASTATPMFGADLTLTSTVTGVSGVPATGTVSFFDGTTSLGSSSIASGQAVFDITTLMPGAHTLTAVYSGDANYASTTSAGITVTVTQGNSTTTLVATPPQVTSGQSFNLTATVADAVAAKTGQPANTPTGSVTFFGPNNANLGTVALVAGSATISQTLIALGSYNYTATYSGDTDFNTSTSSATPTTVIVKTAGSSTTIAATPTSGTFGSTTFSFSAQVTPAIGGPATGTVSFRDGITVLGTSPLSNSGAASISNIALSGGTHSIIAMYSGDATFTSSDTSAAPAVVTVSTATTATGLSATPSTTTFGNSVTLSASVTNTTSTVATGTITFKDGSTVLSTVTLSANGAASYVAANLPVATHNITAVYSGDTNFSASSSAVTPVTINQISQTITLAGVPSTLTYGAPPFVINATASSNLAVSLSVSGPAKITGATVTITGAGTVVVTATQPGDANYAAAPTATSSIMVAQAPLTVAVANQTIAYGAPLPTYTGSITGLVNGDNITATYSSTATSNSLPGTYPISAALADPSGRLPNYVVSNPGGTLTITSLSQTITFPAPPASLVYGAAPVALTATSSSGLAVVYTVSGPGAVSGSALSITGAGKIIVTATQPGNNTYSAAAPVSQTINVATAPLTVTAANATRAYGAANPTFTGTLTGIVNGDAITATYSTTATTASMPGSYPITPALVDPNARLANYSVTIAPGSLTVTTNTSTVTIGSSATTSAFGSPVTFSVTVAAAASGTPTGTVTFKDGATVLNVATLSSTGTATFTTSALAVGPHTISATYSGDTDFTANTSAAPASVTVGQAASATALAANPTSAAFGAPVVLTATVTNATTTQATGTVTFKDGAATLGTGTLSAAGVATFTASSLAGGSHILTAVYGGDTNFIASTSPATTVTISGAPTTTAITGSSAAVNLGTKVTFTATISSTVAGTPTGTVNFLDGATVIGSGTISGGIATFSTTTLTVGSHTIKAAYNGDTNYSASTSASGFTVAVAVASASTSVTVSPSTIVFGGGTLTFSAKVTTTLPIAPTGTITIKAGATTLGTATLTAGAATITVNSTTLGAGAYSAIAYYSGDANYAASDSSAAPAAFTITAAPTATSLALSATQIGAGGSLTLTAAVTSPAGKPSGTVTFLNGSTVLATATLSNGAASATVTTLGLGTYSITASYAASDNFAGSVSAPQTLMVLTPVGLVVNPSTLTLLPGTIGISTITVSPALGFTGSVAMACTSPVAYITCSITSPITIIGTTPGTATATITVAPTVIGDLQKMPTPGQQTSRTWYALLLPFGAALLLPLARGRKGKRSRTPLGLLIAFLMIGTVAAGVSGCGGKAAAVTPAGPQVVTVTATAGGTTVTSLITVNVTH